MSPLKQALHFVTGNKSAWFIVGVHASDEMQPNVAGWLEVTCVSSEVIQSHQVQPNVSGWLEVAKFLVLVVATVELQLHTHSQGLSDSEIIQR